MRILSKAILAPIAAAVLGGHALAADSTATYLANEGVLIERGNTKIVFDPLFDNGYDQYQLLPEELEAALMEGEAPFDGIDAVFVSHYHGDHFSAAKMLDYLRAQPDVRLYAPMQAVSALREQADGGDDEIFDRVVGLALELGDDPFRLSAGELGISAVRIPHSGWPTRRTDIENIVFRVTLDDAVTVAHFGDADTTLGHYEDQTGYWGEVTTDLALPPYWFFLTDDGRTVLDDIVDARDAVGVHVPTEVPDDPSERPPEIQGFDLFTEPLQTRDIGE